MKKAQPELILPAGSLDKLQVACAYGADAVYAGMPQFSLRARTNSFSEAQLAEGLEYAHARGVKLFLTLNIFARNARIEASLKALRALAPLRPDAVIVSDPGLVMLVRREFPDLELHLSTQANTMNWAAVEFWRTQGVKRVILPRELSIDEIREIHARAPEVDLEVFVHGAMCVSYSGRCLLSSYLTIATPMLASVRMRVGGNINYGQRRRNMRWKNRAVPVNGFRSRKTSMAHIF